MNARADGIVGMHEPAPAVAHDEARAKQRLAIAARVAAGMCACPTLYECGDWQKLAALDAWAVAGNLLRLAETGGC